MINNLKDKNFKNHNDNKIIKNNPWKPTLIYIIYGFLVILLSDRLIGDVIKSKDTYEFIQTYKGWFYVIFTAGVLYFLFKIDYLKIFKLSKRISAKNTELVAFSKELIAMEGELNNRIDQLYQVTISLTNQKQLVEEFFNSSNTAIMVWRLDGEILDINNYFTKLLGFDETVIGEKWGDFLIHKKERNKIIDLITRLKKTHKTENSKIDMMKKDGSILNMLWTDAIIQNPCTNELIVVSFGIDITSEREKERKIIELATKDQLTSLNSRIIFDEDVRLLIKDDKQFSLYILDIDDFNLLNDLHGHMYGDIFLKQLASALKEIKKDLKIYRWGGDEIVILEKVIGICAIESTIDKINNIMAQNWNLNGLNYSSSASIGIVSYPTDGSNLGRLFANLDIALKQAKIQGKAQHQYYCEEFIDAVRYSIAIENELDKALSENHLELFYQPIYKLETKSIAGLEGLLRWPNNSFNETNIGNIIKVAEKTGQIMKIDEWVINKAFKTLSKYREQFNNRNISINISTQSFYSEGFLNYLEEKIFEYDINTKGIELEITEYSIIKNFNRAATIMTSLKSLGFKIALDDFGTKYSSLNYLTKLPFDILKIDKSYIDDILSVHSNKVIVKHIINLANELGLQTIVEGIEQKEQMKLLTDMGCSFAQGFYMSKPVDLEQALRIDYKYN